VRFFRTVGGGGWKVSDADVGSVGLYSDIGTEIAVDPTAREITGIDLDLDVILIGDRLWLDDEDEFAEHRVSMGYPDDVASRAEQDAEAVLSLVRANLPPFDGRATDWLARFAASRGL
jgi:protein associated with RNAse G/E